MRVLLTEDNQELAALTALGLRRHGFAVDVVHSGEETLSLLDNLGEYDIVILDLILPDIPGTVLLKRIKAAAPGMPVLALTGKDTVDDRVEGLKIGFDDYLTKPFSSHELAARLRVLVRSQPVGPEVVIKIGHLEIQPQSQTVLVSGRPVKLSLNEFRLLHLLVQKRGRVIPFEEILDSVWDRNGIKNHGKVETTVSRLRAKLGDQQKKIIKTAPGGYVID